MAMGDDTAVTTERPDRVLLATTDTLVEDVHFAPSYTSPFLLGRKAVSVSLSDIAAMGGEPLFLLASLVVAPDREKEFIDALYDGMASVMEPHGVELVGGNTCAGDGPMAVTTTVLGEAAAGEVVYRRGASVGDDVYVTGTPGDSALGLRYLRELGRAALEAAGPVREAAFRHLDPTPRVAAGALLARRRAATAMIDISDGVLLDLGRLCRESGVGAVVEEGRFPLSRAMEAHAEAGGETAPLILAGGEDYELLFTAPPDKAPMVREIASQTGLAVRAVGRIVDSREGVAALDRRGRPIEIAQTGFDHFGSRPLPPCVDLPRKDVYNYPSNSRRNSGQPS